MAGPIFFGSWPAYERLPCGQVFLQAQSAVAVCMELYHVAESPEVGLRRRPDAGPPTSALREVGDSQPEAFPMICFGTGVNRFICFYIGVDWGFLLSPSCILISQLNFASFGNRKDRFCDWQSLSRRLGLPVTAA